MNTKAIVATLLVAAAASADARFAWPYPPKAVSPDEIGHWVVINGNTWSHGVESELTTDRTGEKSPRSKGKIPHVAGRSPVSWAHGIPKGIHVL
jgi:hypothetical protein